MRLSEYLQKHEISHADFAQTLGVWRQTVYDWTRGERIPSVQFIERISEETNGSVQANDFYAAKKQYVHLRKINGRRTKSRKSA